MDLGLGYRKKFRREGRRVYMVGGSSMEKGSCVRVRVSLSLSSILSTWAGYMRGPTRGCLDGFPYCEECPYKKYYGFRGCHRRPGGGTFRGRLSRDASFLL